MYRRVDVGRHVLLAGSTSLSHPTSCSARSFDGVRRVVEPFHMPRAGQLRTYTNSLRGSSPLDRSYRSLAYLQRGDAFSYPVPNCFKASAEKGCVAKSGDRNSWFTPRTSGLCNRALGPWRPLCSGAIEVKTGICVPRLLFLLTGLGPCRSRCVASSEPLTPASVEHGRRTGAWGPVCE